MVSNKRAKRPVKAGGSEAFMNDEGQRPELEPTSQALRSRKLRNIVW